MRARPSSTPSSSSGAPTSPPCWPGSRRAGDARSSTPCGPSGRRPARAPPATPGSSAGTADPPRGRSADRCARASSHRLSGTTQDVTRGGGGATPDPRRPAAARYREATTMRALTVRPGKPGSVQLEELPDPVPGNDELLVHGIAVGVCGTDKEIVRGDYGCAPPG